MITRQIVRSLRLGWQTWGSTSRSRTLAFGKPPLSQLTGARLYSQKHPEPVIIAHPITGLAVTFGLGLAGYGVYYVVHLETIPETGRRRFMVISPAEEKVLGQLAVSETVLKFGHKILPASHPLTQQVHRITQRILVSSDLGHLTGEGWAVFVVDDRELVNAFAAPGLVCVSTGILPLARDEAGLAAIIGHEIAHVTLRHPAEKMSQSKFWLAIIGLLYAFGIDPGISGLAATYLHSLPHSRALEREADIVGLKLMSRACYDPGAAPRVFESLKQLQRGPEVPEFFNTHPPTAERITHLKGLLPQNYEIYNSNPECIQLGLMRAEGILGTGWVQPTRRVWPP
ncbi:peptidase family M48-domain-containing protein [Mycena filopes]|nr:peptidase family M48-domain-containing protein [Mycena filopes]